MFEDFWDNEDIIDRDDWFEGVDEDEESAVFLMKKLWFTDRVLDIIDEKVKKIWSIAVNTSRYNYKTRIFLDAENKNIWRKNFEFFLYSVCPEKWVFERFRVQWSFIIENSRVRVWDFMVSLHKWEKFFKPKQRFTRFDELLRKELPNIISEENSTS